MPRQLRVEYPGAIYQLMSRGDRKKGVFLDDVDWQDFLKTPAEACQQTGLQAHAYWLMRSHFHLVVLAAVRLLLSPATGEAQVLSSGTLVLTEADNGTTGEAVVGQAVTVGLHGNLTTGFEWVLASADGDSVLTNGPATYTVEPGGGVGVGGIFSLPFLAAKAGDTALAFHA